MAGVDDALGADEGEARLQVLEDDVVEGDEDGGVGIVVAVKELAEPAGQPVDVLELLDLDDEAEADGAGMVERLDERRHALALEALVEPRAGVERLDLG